MLYYYLVGTTVLVSHEVRQSLTSLYEVFLKSKGYPNPFTPKADIEEWVKKREEFMKKLKPLNESFIKWLVEHRRFEIIQFTETIELNF